MKIIFTFVVMNIGQTIKEMRKERKLKQKDLAKMIGMTSQNLGFIESGKIGLSKKTTAKIIKALNTDEAVLYFRALEEKDVNPKKVELFRSLQPIIVDLVKSYDNAGKA
jgi:transcriptional regulator with XRE-family HTH domain